MKKYRLLIAGETILEGDQYFSNMSRRWKPTTRICGRVDDDGTKYRRKIKQMIILEDGTIKV